MSVAGVPNPNPSPRSGVGCGRKIVPIAATTDAGTGGREGVG